jgi:hypothetical protein
MVPGGHSSVREQPNALIENVLWQPAARGSVAAAITVIDAVKRFQIDWTLIMARGRLPNVFDAQRRVAREALDLAAA